MGKYNKTSKTILFDTLKVSKSFIVWQLWRPMFKPWTSVMLLNLPGSLSLLLRRKYSKFIDANQIQNNVDLFFVTCTDQQKEQNYNVLSSQIKKSVLADYSWFKIVNYSHFVYIPNLSNLLLRQTNGKLFMYIHCLSYFLFRKIYLPYRGLCIFKYIPAAS